MGLSGPPSVVRTGAILEHRSRTLAHGGVAGGIASRREEPFSVGTLHSAVMELPEAVNLRLARTLVHGKEAELCRLT